MIPALLAKFGLPVLLSFFGESLKKLKHPVADTAAKAIEEVDKVLKNGEITEEKQAEANRHLEEMAKLKAEQHNITLTEINKSLRAEVASNDPYVRRMRPTFGYIVALTWGAQMLSLAYIIVFETNRAGVVIEAMENLGTIWAVGLSVLGIYVYKRSKEKELGTFNKD